MFDFNRWQQWLREAAVAMQAIGVDAELLSGGNLTAKPCCCFRIKTAESLGQFTLWTTGEADFDIMDRKSAKFTRQSWSNLLTDSTLEKTFSGFLSQASVCEV